MSTGSGSTTGQRFSGRVEAYIRARPGYPPQVLDALRRECGLQPHWAIADIGSGTGILTEMFLKHGNTVYGVEPNQEMREASGKLLAAYPRFHPREGTAEQTTLADRSVEMVTAAQAFHWFDRPKARAEFQRVLKPGGWVVVLFNNRDMDSTFVRDYEALLDTYGTDYRQVRHENLGDDVFAEFFGAQGFKKSVFPNPHTYDLSKLRERLLSSSFVPNTGDRADAMLRDLERIFHKHQRGGVVDFAYQTAMYYGRLSN
jgi:ubiquinone/menaquinone biosynthesis C-methylase UbiE